MFVYRLGISTLVRVLALLAILKTCWAMQSGSCYFISYELEAQEISSIESAHGAEEEPTNNQPRKCLRERERRRSPLIMMIGKKNTHGATSTSVGYTTLTYIYPNPERAEEKKKKKKSPESYEMPKSKIRRGLFLLFYI